MTQALRYLKSQIHDAKNHQLRMEILTQIAELQSIEATDFLLSLLNTHSLYPSDRLRLLCALPKTQDERIPDFIWQQANQEQFPLPIEIMELFGDMQDRRAVPMLIKALITRGLYGGERISAAIALGKIGDERAIPELIKVLPEDRTFVGYERVWIPKHISLAEFAMDALKRFNSDSATQAIAIWEKKHEERAYARVNKLLQLVDAKMFVRWQHDDAVIQLGHYAVNFINRLPINDMMDFKLVMRRVFSHLSQYPEMIPKAAQDKICHFVFFQFENHRQSIYSNAYLEVLRHFDNPQIDEHALDWFTRYHNSWRQLDALYLVSERRVKEAVPLIAEMLAGTRPFSDKPLHLLKALAKIGNAEAQALIETHLAQADLTLKQEFLFDYATLHQGSDNALDLIDEVIAKSDKYTQMKAIRALAKGGNGSFYVLISLLNSNEAHRNAAMQALSLCGDERALPHLLAQAQYDKLDINLRAALQAIGSEAAYRVLNTWESED